MQDARAWDTFSRQTLLPVLEQLEQRRKQMWRSALTAGGVALGVFVIIALALAFWLSWPVGISLVVAFLLAAVVGGSVGYSDGGKIKRDYKSTVIAQIVKFIDSDLSYAPDRHVSQRAFENSRIFPQGIDRYRGEDGVKGTVGKTGIEFSEVHAEYKTRTTDSKGHTRTEWHTIFRGVFFIADFNKDFSGRTLVLPDVAERALGKWLGQMLQSVNVTRSGQLIKLEDPEFEKLFVVYADDQIEARYILSPALMQRIVAYQRQAGCQIYLSFADSTLYLAMENGKDLFEPSLTSPLNRLGQCEGFRDELLLVTEIVEILDLNTRIWSKR